MISNYDKFVGDRLNEGLWDSLKNLFGKLLQGVSDEIKKPVDELNNKLSKTRDPKQIKIIMYNYLKLHNTTLTNGLNKAQDLVQLKNLVQDNLKGIYASITACSKTLGEDEFSFSEVFDDAPAGMKKLFDKNEKNFNKNVTPFVVDLIAKQGKQYGYDEKTTIGKLTAKPEEQAAATDTEQQGQINAAAGKTTVTDGFLSNYKDKLFEEAPQVDAAVPPTNPATPTVDPKVEAANFKKLKDGIKKWFDFAIYKKMNEALKDEKKKTQTLEDKIKAMTTTRHPESVEKMVDAISKLDMVKLKQVRDILGLDKNTARL